MKKFLVLLLAALMVFSFAACGGGGGGEEAAADDSMKVAMVTDYGDITDQSFNQTTYEACKAFCEANGVDFTYKKPASDADADRVSSIEEAIEEGYNVIVMPGYAFANAIYEVAPMYPDVKFVALDVSEYDLTAYGSGAEESSTDRTYSALFTRKSLQATWLVTQQLSWDTQSSDSSAEWQFLLYRDTAADSFRVLMLLQESSAKTDVEIKYVYGGQFFGDADITAAMDTWYGAGTEVVFACGGGIFTSAAEAAAKVGGKVIGVDVDQAGTIDGAYGEGMTVTSAMKGLGATVNTLLAAIQNGNWDDYAGQIQTLGLVSETPADNYVQLPASTVWNDGFSEADYQTLVKELFDGTRTVSNDIEAIPATTAVKVDDQGAIKG